MRTPLQGRCQCGAVSYTASAEPLFTYACHCHSCQQRTGSACSVGLVVGIDALAVTGELSAWTRVSDQGLRNTRYSCAACGNIIYGVGENSPTLAKLQAGTLADTSDVVPEVHLWTRSRQPWLALDPAVRQYDTQPENPVELFEAALAYRAARPMDRNPDGLE